ADFSNASCSTSLNLLWKSGSSGCSVSISGTNQPGTDGARAIKYSKSFTLTSLFEVWLQRVRCLDVLPNTRSTLQPKRHARHRLTAIGLAHDYSPLFSF